MNKVDNSENDTDEKKWLKGMRMEGTKVDVSGRGRKEDERCESSTEKYVWRMVH